MIALARIIAHAWLMPPLGGPWEARGSTQPAGVAGAARSPWGVSAMAFEGPSEDLRACPQRGGFATAAGLGINRRAGILPAK